MPYSLPSSFPKTHPPDDENVISLRSRFVKILNVPLRVRLRF